MQFKSIQFIIEIESSQIYLIFTFFSIQNNPMMTSVAKILKPWSKLAWSKTTENKIKLIRFQLLIRV